MEDDLHSVGGIIEQIASFQCLDNRVLLVILNIVCGYGRPQVYNISQVNETKISYQELLLLNICTTLLSFTTSSSEMSSLGRISPLQQFS